MRTVADLAERDEAYGSDWAARESAERFWQERWRTDFPDDLFDPAS